MDLLPVPPTSAARGTRRRRRLVCACVGAIMMVALIVSIASLALAASSSFPDVPSSHPYYVAVTDLASRGIVSGYDNGNFGPSDPVTRQQFAKMIVGSGGYPVSESDICPFTDVVKGDATTFYPDNFVAVCAAHGITTGKTATTFDPYSDISRAQVITMVVRAADALAAGTLDPAPDGWSGQLSYGDPIHGANIKKAEYNGLLTGIQGPEGTLAGWDSYGNATRGECAQVLHNLLGELTPATTTTSSSTTTTTLPAAGDLIHFWWPQSGLQSTWQSENVSETVDYQIAGDMHRCEQDVPGSSLMHMFGRAPNGDLLMITVTPGKSDWHVTNVSSLTGQKVAFVCDGSSEVPVAASAGTWTIHLMATSPGGDLMHFWWTAGQAWRSENVSQQVGAKVAGRPAFFPDESRDSSSAYIAAAAGLDNEFLLFYLTDGGSWSVENVTTETGVTCSGFARWNWAASAQLHLATVGVDGHFYVLERVRKELPWTVTDVTAITGHSFVPGKRLVHWVYSNGALQFAGVNVHSDLVRLWLDQKGWHGENVSAKTAQEVSDAMYVSFTGSDVSIFCVAPNADLVVVSSGSFKGSWQSFNASAATGHKVRPWAVIPWTSGSTDHLLIAEW